MSARLWIALTLTAGLAIGSGLLASARAQDPAPQNSQPLTKEDLPKWLTNLGYGPEDRGNGVYVVPIERDGWTFRVRTSISSNQKKVWLSAFLGTVADPAKLPPGVLAKVLVANDQIGPAHFYFCGCKTCQEKTEKELNVAVALDNRGLTPPTLRKEIDDFCSTIKSTAEVWQATQQKPPSQ